MPGISLDETIRQLLAVLHEAVEGPPESWSYFTDNRRDAGYDGTLATVTADEASRMISGTSIAAHTHHAAWAMRRSAAWIRGDRNRWDWSESWRLSTVGEDECRAWTLSRGASAVDAAGAIHSDLARGFIRAEVVTFEDLMASGSTAEARKRGKLRSEGKAYAVRDGDVIEVLFNVAR